MTGRPVNGPPIAGHDHRSSALPTQRGPAGRPRPATAPGYAAPTPRPGTLASRYLAALAVLPTAPTPSALVELHRAHVQRFAHDTVWMSRGRVPAPEDVEVAEHLLAGEGGACVHLNWSFAWLLTQLGYEVTRHRALTQSPFDPRPHDDDGGHCVLTVTLDGRRWYVDVGLGNGLLEPIPLAEGVVTQDGGFTYALERRDGPTADVWRFLHDRRVRALRVVEFVDEPVDPAVVRPLYERASLWPESPFVRNLAANRRLDDGVLILSNDTLVRRGPTGRTVTHLPSAGEWEACLREDFLLGLPAWSPEERDRLWAKASGQSPDPAGVVYSIDPR